MTKNSIASLLASVYNTGIMRWPPYQHVFFDCDSTLTTVEGIDVLAETAGKKWRVEVLTNAAMDGKLDLAEIYAKRLRAIRPTQGQVREIRRVYKRHIVEDAKETIAALQYLGHQVYIISGGLAEPVREFGLYLGVPAENIRAVRVDYDQLNGRWWARGYAAEPGRYRDYEAGALTISDGKAQIVRELLGRQHGRSLLIGDGYSDLMAGQAVNLFVGFGGVATRQRVLDKAPAFIHSRSIAPILALAAGPAAARQVSDTEHEAVFQKAFLHIAQGAITFQNERLETKFNRARDAARQTVYTGANGGTA